MKGKNRGFTLIELMIAIAVLSTMAGVLFQVFVVSRRIDAKSATEDAVQNIAKKTMEELKAYSFERIDYAKDKKGTVNIAGTIYSYEPLKQSPLSDDEETDTQKKKRDGYFLKREYRIYGGENEAADYLIYAEADRGAYSLEAEANASSDKEVYSINQYQMPNIADVSSFQNVVLDPVTLAEGDEIRMGELLAKVNPEEEETSEESSIEKDVKEEIIYTEAEIKKYLHLDISESDTGETADAYKGKLTTNVEEIYTVSDKTPSESGKTWESDLTINFPIQSFTKKIELDNKSEKPLNRIYLFLPEAAEVEFEKIYVTAKTDNLYELFVIVQDGSAINQEQFISIKENGTGNKNIRLYTNIGEEKPVSLYPAESRLYHLTVTVYEVDYEPGGNGKPKPGKELLRLDSTKSEQRSGAGKEESTAVSK